MPDEMAEYLDFYETDQPFCYRVEIISNEAEGLAQPFSQIFSNQEEAVWAFDFMAKAANILGIDDADDPRIAINIRNMGKNKALHFSFCNWLIAGFYSPNSQKRVSLPLIVDKVSIEDEYKDYDFSQDKDEPKIYLYKLPIEIVNPLEESMDEVFNETLQHIAERFKNYTQSPYRKFHNQ